MLLIFRTTRHISGNTINEMARRRIALIGLDPTHFSARSIRADFMTQAANAGNNLRNAMALNGHRSSQIASGYYRKASILNNPASQLLTKE